MLSKNTYILYNKYSIIISYINVKEKINNPTASNGASSLQRCRAAGYVTLAAFAKCSCKHSTWLIARGNQGCKIVQFQSIKALAGKVIV